MEVNTAIEVINSSGRSADEKKHLRKLIRNGGLLPASFAGTPNFDEILDDFPVHGKCDFYSSLLNEIPFFLHLRFFR